MPRPGPRPYECVRRAWHSDKHQPIRGSLIQEIFRVVNEIHSPATKKNKEWQEKLPVVVLKAEEIMYSKANSEAEYMDPKTLLDRTNDAINTIIRRDENLETGDLLQPCIEAALNLGCTPTRASRGQHNGNVRFYLSPATQEPNSSSPGLARNTIQANHVNNLKRVPDSNFKRSPITNPTHLGSESKNLVSRNVNFNLSSLCSVYPLHRASCVEPHHGLPNPGSTEPVKIGRTRNFFCCQEEPPVKISRITLADSPSNPKQIECDLPLQLGFSSAPVPGVKGTNLQEVESVDYDCSQRGSKLNNA